MAASCFIEKIMLFPIEEFQPVTVRPYVINPDGNSIDRLSYHLKNNKSGLIDKNSLSIVAGDVVSVSSEPCYGFTNYLYNFNRLYRYIFIMKVVEQATDSVNRVFNISNVYYIQGYTSPMEIIITDSVNNHCLIPDNTVFYVNTIISVIVNFFNTPTGGVQSSTRLNSVFNVISGEHIVGPVNEHYMSRPYDIYQTAKIKQLNISHAYEYSHDINAQDIETINMSSILTPTRNSMVPFNVMSDFSTKTFTSNIDNSQICSYVQKPINACLTDFAAGEAYFADYSAFGMANGTVGSLVHTETPHFIVEPSISDIVLFDYLSKITGRRITSNPVFSYAELKSLDATLDDRVKVIKPVGVNDLTINSPSYGNEWSSFDIKTTYTYLILNSVISKCLEFGFTKFHMEATNYFNMALVPSERVFDSVFNVCTYYRSFLEIDEMSMNVLVENLIRGIIREILIPIIGKHVFSIKIFMDAFSSTKIFINLHDVHEYDPNSWYVAPSFMNSCFSPLVASTQSLVDINAQNVLNMAEEIRHG
ncbi:MAG: hypothetical protein QXF12_01370 [Candidatus Aenigmatarchaeota archaeon]